MDRLTNRRSVSDSLDESATSLPGISFYSAIPCATSVASSALSYHKALCGAQIIRT